MRLLIALGLLTTALSASAQMYRWTDERGKIHFSDTAPPPSARNVQKRSPAVGAPEAAIEPYGLEVTAKRFPVKLYSTPGCEACDHARQLLNTRGVPFAETSVTDGSGIAELKSVVGSNSVPALIVGRTVQKGFEESAYHRLLDDAGYPKSGVLPPRNQSAPKPPGSAQAEPQPVEEEDVVRAPGPYAPRR